MKIPKPVTACAGVIALGAVGFATQGSHAQKRAEAQDRFVGNVATVLAMTPKQKDDAQTAFDQARKAAEPVRQDLRSTNHALQDAIQANDTTQIKRLSATEGKDIGDLVGIRSTAMAQVYKELTPDQQKRATALHDLLMRGLENPDEHHMARSGS